MLGAIALACGTVPLVGATPAYADTASFNGVVGGYFSSTGIRKPDDSPAAVPDGAQPNNQGADGVSKENLAVAARANAVDKQSFVLFDLMSLDIGTTITKATLRMPLVPTSQSDTTYGADPAKVVACPAGEEGFYGEDGTAMQDSPSVKCDVASAPGKLSADGKAYEFDITAIAAGWIDINDGIGLTPAAGARTTPFQVVFGKAEAATLAVEYTAPPAEAEPEVPPVFVPPTDTAPPVDFGGGFDGGTVAPPPFGGETVPPPSVPVVPAPQAGVVPQPQTQPIATTPVSIETLRPDSSLWLGALGLAGLLALLSLIMGDSRVPSAAAGTSRLSQALADRQRGARVARPALGRSLPI